MEKQMFRRSAKVALRLFLLLALGSILGYAQTSPTGSLAGTVVDQSGAVVTGAKVGVKNTATGQEFTTTTADNGTFLVPTLNSGLYQVTITATGFKQSVAESVKIDAAMVSSVNISLEVGASSETVTVVGVGGELLQTQSATIGATITGRQIIEQPQTSRDALDLVTLLPGVQTTGRPRTSTVNGLPKGAINITIDGVDVQDNLISSNDGFFTYVRPRIDSIEEVTVSTATPGAESSGDGAVQIKFVTRGGSNDLRGSLYYQHRNPSLNANYYFNNLTQPPDPRTGKAPRNRVLLNEYGGRVGGPISIPKLFNGKDRAFFFVNYEEFHLPEQQLRNRTIFSSPAQSGIFRYVTGSGVQSVNLLQLAGANGLTSTVDPTVSSLLSQIRTTTSQGAVRPSPNAPNFDLFDYVAPGGQVRYFSTVRLDFNLSSKHHLENVWNYQEFGGKLVDFLNNTDPAFPGFPNFGGQISQRWSNAIALRSTFTSNVINEARFAMLGGQSNFYRTVSASQFANQGGFELAFSDAAYGTSNLPLTNPTATNGTSHRNTPTFTFSDAATWVRGTHSFSFGGSYSLIKTFADDINQLVPKIFFGVIPGDPAEALFTPANFPGASAADLIQAAQIYSTITGRVQAVESFAFLNDGKYELLGSQVTRYQQKQYAFYAQDSWRARPDLTLSLGLRWEPQLPVVSRNRSFAKTTYEDLFGISGVGNLFKPGTLTGRPTQFTELAPNEKLYDGDYNNFAPSVGVAWSPQWKEGWLARIFGRGGESAIRGGYSMAFVREGLANVSATTGSNPGGFANATRDASIDTLPIGTLLRNTAALGPAPFPATPEYPFLGSILDAAFGLDPKLKTGVVHSWTFGVQREIFKDTVFEARYVGTRGVDLWRRFNLNETNIIENRFLDEFKLAQANLTANIAAGRGQSYAYFGPNTGTSPLPIMLAYFSGVPTAQASDAARYTSTQFRNATRIGNLARQNANPIGFANVLATTFFPNAAAAGLPTNFFLVNPDKLGGASLTTNDIDTRYDGLTFEVRRRLSGGLLLQGSYTFSKSFINAFASSQTVLSQPSTLREGFGNLDRVRAPQDLTHAFKANWIYDLPVGRGRRFLGDAGGIAERILGGWSFHGTARIQSGRPFQLGNVQLVGMTRDELQEAVKVRKNNVNAAGQPSLDIFFLPDDIILNTRRAFSVSATSATGYGALGVPTGRYIAPANSNGCLQGFRGGCGFSNLILNGPMFTRFDLSIVKRVRITEGTNFEFRAEFLNAFNNINFLVGGTAAADVAQLTTTPAAPNYSAGTFGTVTAAYQDVSTTNDPGGRLIKFVARINF